MNNELNSHLQRMKDEHKELIIKQTALDKFIHSNEVFKTLCDLEQARMIKQSGFMDAYAKILEQRIWTYKSN